MKQSKSAWSPLVAALVLGGVLIIIGSGMRGLSPTGLSADAGQAVTQRPWLFKKYELQASLSVPTANKAAPLETYGSTGISSCATNTLASNVVVSISQRHMWACDGVTTRYESPVITGMENLAADLTPTGTYHIYSEQTNLYLKGSDSTGSWDDYVNYWLPFLSNRYGVYGFHDATWRDNSAFGNIDPYSADGSHGCVELPLATAAWLYNWAVIGTTVTIIN